MLLKLYKSKQLTQSNWLWLTFLLCARDDDLKSKLPFIIALAAHPFVCPWSSYGYNVLGQTDNLVNPHPEYLRLGRTDEECLSTYRRLFKHRISERGINAIREATNRGEIGKRLVQAKYSRELKRRVEPAARGAHRRTEQFKIDRI